MVFFSVIRFYIYRNRDIAGTLAVDNERLRDYMRQTEKDTIDAVTFLRKKDGDKDAEVNNYYFRK